MSSTFTPSPVQVPDPQQNQKRGPGGTPGGMGSFLLGVVMAVGGGWLITNQVTVSSSFNMFGFGMNMGRGGFGLTMLPLLFGIGFLFYNGKSLLGWMITGCGAAIILLAVLMNMQIFWKPTSLFNTVLMWGMFVAGLGLILRSLRASNSNW